MSAPPELTAKNGALNLSLNECVPVAELLAGWGVLVSSPYYVNINTSAVSGPPVFLPDGQGLVVATEGPAVAPKLTQQMIDAGVTPDDPMYIVMRLTAPTLRTAFPADQTFEVATCRGLVGSRTISDLENILSYCLGGQFASSNTITAVWRKPVIAAEITKDMTLPAAA